METTAETTKNNIFAQFIGQKCVIRSLNAGVFYGTVAAIDGDLVLLNNARKLWYWDGAAAVEGIAATGVTKPDNCKFTVTVDSIGVTGVCQVLPCTETAQKSIETVKEWVA